MALVALQLLSGTAVSVEATLVTSTLALPAALLPSGVAAGTRVTVAGVVYDILGAKATVDAAIAGGVLGLVQETSVEATQNNATTTLATALTMITPASLPAGNYIIAWYGELGTDNVAALDVRWRVDLDATSVSSVDGVTLAGDQPAGIVPGVVVFDVYQVADSETPAGWKYLAGLTAGAHTFRVKWCRTGAANNAQVIRARLALFRV